MGINGLLPVIKTICQERHVQDLAHTRVGIDVYGWLHKGAFSCAMNLCRGIDTTQFVHFCMHRVRMLIHFKVTPVLIFDGADLPMKAETHNERRERREEAMRKAEEAFASGNKKRAEEWYQRAYTVTSEMARLVIRECRKINVEYVVAPYEADAQLAWMIKTGYIDGVITEDSDMLVYGASKILFKMNRFGNGDLYESRNLLSLDSLNMNNFTEDMFMYMSVCSGCDFFKGVQGLGVKKSHAIVKRFRTMTRLILAIRQDRRFKVQKSFARDFARACLVFRHQTVFDMRTSQHIYLSDFDDEAKAKLPQGILSTNEDGTLDLSFLGAHRDAAKAKQIAEGLIHPRSLQEYMDPLDIISRPVTNKVRPRGFPSPPRRRRVQSNETQKVRGFQIQPASTRYGTSANDGGYTNRRRFSSSLNLRQRLSNRSKGTQIFNPRRAGAAFRAKHGSVAGSSGIWASFKSCRDIARSSDEHIETVIPAASDVPTIIESKLQKDAEKHATEQDENLAPGQNTTPPEDDSLERPSSEHQIENRGELPEAFVSPKESVRTNYKDDPNERYDSEQKEDSEPREVLSVLDAVQSPKRRRVTSSHRVEAVNRALGRFAQTEKKDVKKKFIPCEKSSSTKVENCDPLADMNDVLSRPAEKDNHSPKQDVKSQSTKEAKGMPRARSVSQVRLSRFFQMREQNERDPSKGSSPMLKPIVVSRKNPSKHKTGIQKARKLPGANSLNKFRRGAVGKTAVVHRKKVVR